MYKPDSQVNRMKAALLEGPKTNSFFVRRMGIFKYTSRISDLRAQGWIVIAHNQGDGLFMYQLKGRVKS